jgi:predicted PurR-regulated permease PerM
MAMERNTLLLLLLITGCITCLVGFLLAQFFPALIIVAIIIAAFLYSDFKESHNSGSKDLKKNTAVAVFVIVTAYCMITGWWIFWAGITAMLYIDALIETIKEWFDGRQLAYLNELNAMQSTGSLQQTINHLEQRISALEREKSG